MTSNGFYDPASAFVQDWKMYFTRLENEKNKTFAAFDRLENQNRIMLNEMRSMKEDNKNILQEINNMKEENKMLQNKLDQLVGKKSSSTPSRQRLKRELKALQKPSESVPRSKKKKRIKSNDENTSDDVPATFNSLCNDTLCQIIGFAGRSYGTVGLINRRCNRLYSKYSLPKETYLFGYAPLSLIRERDKLGFGDYDKEAKAIIHYNRADILDWYIRRQYLSELKKVMVEGSSAGRLDILKEVFENADTRFQEYLPWCMETCPAAAKNNHLETLKWLRSKGFHWGTTFEAAFEGGSESMLNWLYREECPISFATLGSAAKRGDISWVGDILPYDCFDGEYDDDVEPVCAKAASGGHVKMTQWLKEKGAKFTSDKISSAAAMEGQMDMLKWLKTQNCDFTEKTFEAAAKSGSVEVLKWLKEVNCPKGEDAVMCANAAKEGHLDALKWLQDEGWCALNEDTFVNAIYSKNIDILKWLKEQGCPWNEEVSETAYTHGTIEIRRWLRIYRCPEPPHIARMEI